MVDYTKMSCIIGCKENKYITYFPPIKCWLCDSHRHLREILEQNLSYKKVEVATCPGRTNLDWAPTVPLWVIPEWNVLMKNP